ncbi:MAG TPA: ceramidase domain-containing protein [Bryobacteraceae bacterium]|nr:ceramidase domain-containing protein [Bryobacteraceae bacterium]
MAVLLLAPPITQDPGYHSFADHRGFWGIPNFWNVVSNLLFLFVALWGARALRSPAAFGATWERVAYCILLAGVALVAFGSAYYHAWPNNTTLVWDRLPMAIVFMALLASTIGERVGMNAGRLLLFPLLLLGVASVWCWHVSGDLRPYIVVQFYPMIALPLMLLLFPPRYSGAAGLWAMIGFYGLAKIFEFFDSPIGAVLASGGHPWKHVAGAAAMFCYVQMVAQRRLLPVRT